MAGLAAAVGAVSPAVHGQAPGPAASPSRPPLVLQADQIEGQPDRLTQATGDVRARQGDVRIDAPRLTVDRRLDRLSAEGGVLLGRQGDRFRGPRAEVQLDASTGRLEQPVFFFETSGAGGSARQLNVLDAQRVELLDAVLTSCLQWPDGRLLREPGTPVLSAAARALMPTRPAAPPIDDTQPLSPPPEAVATPGWSLQARRVLLDGERQEGTAEVATLRFQGVPLIVLPRLSFPLGDARRSGWLPPTVRLDSRIGIELSAPYYLNLAPHLDATLTPMVSTRRGSGAEGEFRYLLDQQTGQFNAHLLPNDRSTGRSRSALRWTHEARFGPTDASGVATGWWWRTRGLRVSDDAYWKDFGQTETFLLSNLQAVESAAVRVPAVQGPRPLSTLQPRLLGRDLDVERQGQAGAVAWTAYSRVQQWQVLQGTDPNALITAPYTREPQLGVTARVAGAGGSGLTLDLEAEFNRFRRPALMLDPAANRIDGQRWHAVAHLWQAWRWPGAWLRPGVRLQTAHYDTERPMADGRSRATLSIPSASLDGGMQFERPLTLFGRALRQTLEPRLVYVNTAFREQSTLPNFDAAPKDFNSISIFSDRAYSGIDRVADAHQITAGVTSRVLDPATGEELLRASAAQRLRLREQRLSEDPAGGRLPDSQRLSDLLLAATVGLIPSVAVDSVLQYSPERSAVTRSVVSARYGRSPLEAVALGYRYARGASEALELRWIWPLWRAPAPTVTTGLQALAAGGCRWQVGSAGRVNYSLRDSRIADSLLGVEVDAGCWVGRLGVQRQSTGLTEAVTRLILQLELMGLSRAANSPFAF